MSGGKFGHGFISAGVTKGVGGTFLPGGSNLSSGEIASGTAISAVIGGTVSSLTGGKFANGAQTGAFQYLFNQASVAIKQEFAKFKELWNEYPKGTNGRNARPSSDSYAINQCAIRVGVALDGSGMDMTGYPSINKTSEGFPRSSKGLADWLWNEVRPPMIMSQTHFDANYADKTGLIYLAPPQGAVGHIDLWNIRCCKRHL